MPLFNSDCLMIIDISHYLNLHEKHNCASVISFSLLITECALYEVCIQTHSETKHHLETIYNLFGTWILPLPTDCIDCLCSKHTQITEVKMHDLATSCVIIYLNL